MHPFLSRHLVYPLQERLLKRPTFPYLAALERSQWLSREELERLQMRKLAALLSLANAHCPWHARRLAEAGLGAITPNSELTRADLERIPTMDKADAQLHGEQMRWTGVPGGAFAYNTGGSSGQPLRFYYGRLRQAADAASRIRARRWWGVNVGQREVYLWGSPVELNKTDRIKTIRDHLLNQVVLNAFDMSQANMDTYLVVLERYDPVCLYGYASSVALLAAHAKERQRIPHLRSLKVVCTTGEPLYPHQRDIISEVFSVPVANEFGSRDSGFIGHETPAGQMLAMSESIFIEVLNPQGHPVGPNEIGEAVITGLCSDAQPFIRYHTGDTLSLSHEVCREGRGLHVIDQVVGRSTDFVVKSDGTVMHALSVIYILRAIEGVAEFKIVQHQLDLIEIQIVPNPRWQETNKLAIVQAFKRRLGDSIAVDIHLVDKIPPEASGKHRYVVSHVTLPVVTFVGHSQQQNTDAR
ncbi:phenylacetate--CoA ligase family protein [Thiocystis violascens]|uniref:Coenzyme F390 synthetase n=1 Tax=Thiocystis violascens (strain ATCC 17096 / DSM 198 / 6111) TaxID=765911 RepID=I3YEV9_THIV6|nr:phenylacetate--CoA ligase family protein [Thiocystis violascens]AFL75527.1 coenzyme F390 synthetase [Thiocystis violascens DSM 198]